MSYSPQKSDFLAFFSRGEHDNGQQFEQLIFIKITLFFIEFFFKWMKKIFQSKNLIHPTIDDYPLRKILRGEHDNGHGNFFKILFYRGEHDKGGIWQRVLR